MQVVLTPDFSQYELNDAATRAFSVGSAVCRLAPAVRSVELVAGEQGSLAIAASHQGGATPTLTLSLKPLPPATTLPAGLTASFNPAEGQVSPFTSTLTLTTTTALAPGRYSLAVLGLGKVCNAVTTFTLVVHSPNHAPVADAGTDSAVDENDSVALDGSASHDADNDTLTYYWTQVAGPEVSLNINDPLHPSFVAPAVPSGNLTLTFELVVFDGYRASVPAIVNITDKHLNHAPVSDAGLNQTVQEGSPVTLDNYSYDTDSDALTYSWCQPAGPAVTLSSRTESNPTFTAPQVGSGGATLTFKLTVSDGVASAHDTVSIMVSNVNQRPVAAAGADQTVNEGSVVTLNGGGSSDPDDDTLGFLWTQVSGPDVSLSNADTVSAVFTAPAVDPNGADLVFRLVVNDGARDSLTDDLTVHVQNLDDPPLCNLARPSVASLWPPDHKLAAVVIAGVTDPNNDHVTLSILAVTQDEPLNGLGDGDTSPDAVIQGSSVLLRSERSGTGNGRVYRVEFQADDGNGGVCTGTVGVSVPHDRNSTAVNSGQNYDSLTQ